MRTTLSTRTASVFVSLLIQYSLVISVLAFPGVAKANAQEKEKAAPVRASVPEERAGQGPENAESAASKAQSAKPSAEASTGSKAPLREDRDKSLVDDKKPPNGLPEWVTKAGSLQPSSGLSTVADIMKGFDNTKFSGIGTTLLGNKDSVEPGAAAQQDPRRAMPRPSPPEIGSGGTGPGGTFNVDPPERRQGPPEGVRSASEVLNEVRTAPRIPDAIPSTQPYCWPGDPACRKPQVKPSPIADPTPPPRPSSSHVRPEKRPTELAADAGGYLKNLFRELTPYVKYLPVFAGSLRLGSVLGTDLIDIDSESKAPPARSAEPGEAAFVWADCNNVQGYAYGSVWEVYIYVDGMNIGTTYPDWNAYFIYDISTFVNDGGSHYVSAWYYDWNWGWVEAGSSWVSGCMPDFNTPRLHPVNETGGPGVNPGSQNINWSIPLVSLPGRAGLDLNLMLTYNSLVWTKSADGTAIMFDTDHGFPSPGFRLRFPIIQPQFFNTEASVWSYMLVTSSGGRIELRQVGGTNTYESADGSYMRMVVDYGTGNAVVWLKDGTQMTFQPSVNSEMRCTQIKDRNGNFISVTYTPQGNINTVTDTLGRQVVFVYDGNQRLLRIEQQRNGTAHYLATFGYSNVSFSPSFPFMNVIGPWESTIPALTQVGLPDGKSYQFEYTTFGQVNKIRRHEADTRLLSYTRYNLGTGSQSDCPRFSEEYVWAENWNNSQEAVTSYSGNVTSGLSQVTTPDGVVHKQFYHTTGWERGLIQKTETWSGGVQRKRTEMLWTQDNVNLSYQQNPRPYDINVYDESGNRRRITIEYTSFSLPQNVREYAADGLNVSRRTYLSYRWDDAYISRRIIGLPWVQQVFQGESALLSKIENIYDWTDSRHFSPQAPSTGHDAANYGAGFVVGRGNLTGTRRFNVFAPNDENQAVWLQLYGYNAAGSLFVTRDALDFPTWFSYSDSYSDGNNTRNTLAYPTTVTDPDNFSSTAQYNFDFGGLTRMQNPKGAVQAIQYDTVARVERVTNEATGGYTRWEYTPVGEVVTLTQVDVGQPETLSVQYVDGGGRPRGVISHLPNSAGGWRAQMWDYDIMGRLSSQTNPAEVTGAWQPAGDDAAGWISSLQSYDWQGRPTVTTNQDGSTRENSYSGCGCAGGDVVTVRDERGRRRRLTNDVVGRLVRVEELNWDQSVYSTTNYTYNARDQITQINQEGQLRTFAYDGHGRLNTRTTPEQGSTTYSYYLDDTVQTVTDARGASMTFSYNPRHLVEGITFYAPSGVAATPNVTFGYDAAGNRTSMSSSESTVTYNYDTASRLTSETRTFNGLSGSFTLSYQYNQASQLKQVTNPWGAVVGYSYNHAGEVTGVTGQNYAGVSSYASGMVYRAFGGLKQMNYGNGRSLSLGYNNRMFLTQYSIPNVMRWNYAYHYFNENTGRVVYAQNLDDGTLDRSYDYDHVGRPTHFTSGSNARHHTGQGGTPLHDGPYSHGYAFDVWGNRTSMEGWGGIGRSETASYTNNRRNGFTYDAAGNLTNDGGQTFSYDATGQQATASYSGYLLQQTYDGDRLRVKKVDNGATIYYLRSTVLGGQIVAELNGSGTWTRGFVYLGGELLAVQQNNQVSWVHQDPVAKSKRVTDGAGGVVSTIELDPWGGDTARSNNEVFQPRRFTTYDRDGNASDEAMHRRYNRWHSRFDQPDPWDGSYSLSDPQSFNRYSYVKNDPVNFVDPTGLDCAAEYNRTGGCTVNGGSSEVGMALALHGSALSPNRQPLAYIDPIGGGGSGIDFPIRPPNPVPGDGDTESQDLQALFDKVKKDCLERKKAQADRAREQYVGNFGRRIANDMAVNAATGAIRGAYVGATVGFMEAGVGAVPGALLGATVGAIATTAAGVFKSVVKEPFRRTWYDYWNYKPALNAAHLDCDAEARTAVTTAQMGGRR